MKKENKIEAQLKELSKITGKPIEEILQNLILKLKKQS